MKITKKFIQDVAAGIYNEEDLYPGEMQRIAKIILKKNLVQSFVRYCFPRYRRGNLEHWGDIFDAFVHFCSFGSIIEVEVPKNIHPLGVWQCFGMTPEDSLKELWNYAKSHWWKEDQLLQKTFSIRGQNGKYRYSPKAFNEYFGNGNGSIGELMSYIRVA